MMQPGTCGGREARTQPQPGAAPSSAVTPCARFGGRHRAAGLCQHLPAHPAPDPQCSPGDLRHPKPRAGQKGRHPLPPCCPEGAIRKPNGAAAGPNPALRRTGDPGLQVF